ncbi:hypothetical protein [Treponema vincentii]|uniref:hypothetical protein n=1 Tax=Treponema vincentii TaxID=69710 RepID=UPI001E30DB45|nr:hypothetical protein [Treponema vincentii]
MARREDNRLNAGVTAFCVLPLFVLLYEVTEGDKRRASGIINIQLSRFLVIRVAGNKGKKLIWEACKRSGNIDALYFIRFFYCTADPVSTCCVNRFTAFFVKIVFEALRFFCRNIADNTE